MKKRLFVFFLTAMVLFGSLPMPALATQAPEGYDYIIDSEEDKDLEDSVALMEDDKDSKESGSSKDNPSSEEAGNSVDNPGSEEAGNEDNGSEKGNTEDVLERNTENVSDSEDGNSDEDAVIDSENTVEEDFNENDPDQAAGDDPAVVANEIKGLDINLDIADYGSTAEAILKEDKDGEYYLIAAGSYYAVEVLTSPAYTTTGEAYKGLYGSELLVYSGDATAYLENENIGLTVPDSALIGGKLDLSLTVALASNSAVSRTVRIKVLPAPKFKNSDFTTFIWTDLSDKLRDACLDGNWEWVDPDTTVDGLLGNIMWSYPVKPVSNDDVYPMERSAFVQFYHAPDPAIDMTENEHARKMQDGFYLEKGQTAVVTVNRNFSTTYTGYIEGIGLSAVGKNKDHVTITPLNEEKTEFSVTSDKEGAYPLAYTYELFNPKFDEKGMMYRGGSAGTVVKNLDMDLHVYSKEKAPVEKIELQYDPEELTKSGFYKDDRYEETFCLDITSAEEAKNLTEKKLSFTMKASDINGADVTGSTKFKITSSDSSLVTAELVKVKSDKKDDPAAKDEVRLNIKIKKGEGLATLKITAMDDNACTKSISFWIRNYAPQKKTVYEVTFDKNISYTQIDPRNEGFPLASVYMPYGGMFESAYLVDKPLLNREPTAEDYIKGVKLIDSDRPYLFCNYKNKDPEYLFKVLPTDDLSSLETGTLSCYLLVKYQEYKDYLCIPVKINITDQKPTVTVKQLTANNLFFKDTTKEEGTESSIGKVAGILKVSYKNLAEGSSLDKIEWIPKDTTNSGFSISGRKTDKGNYIIDTNSPKLNADKKADPALTEGKLRFTFKGYKDPIELDYTIKTRYVKPVLSAKVFKLSPESGVTYAWEDICTNVYGYKNQTYDNNKNSIRRGDSGTSIGCQYEVMAYQASDQELNVKPESGSPGGFKILYSGKKDTNVTVTFTSGHWNEKLEIVLKVKVITANAKLSPAAVTLNAKYPADRNTTWATAYLLNTKADAKRFMNNKIQFDKLEVTATGASKKLLDDGLINIYGANMTSSYNSFIMASLNSGRAMNGEIKSGTYKYTIKASYKEVTYPARTLTVKIIGNDVTVKVKTNGTLNLLKISDKTDSVGNYYYLTEDGIKVTPKFKNLDSSYVIYSVYLRGDYSNYFYAKDLNEKTGICYIVPREIGKLKAGKTYKLEIEYQIKDYRYGEADFGNYNNNGRSVCVKDTIKVKPIQKAPKVTLSQVVICASNQYETRFDISVPKNYSITSVTGSLDVDKDGTAEIEIGGVSYEPTVRYSRYIGYSRPWEKVKATKSGVTYKVPVTVTFAGSDGTKSGSTTVYLKVKVKK